jgi:hypothetical protein
MSYILNNNETYIKSIYPKFFFDLFKYSTNHSSKLNYIQTIGPFHSKNSPPLIYKKYGKNINWLDFIDYYSKNQISGDFSIKPPVPILKIIYDSIFIPLDIQQWIETHSLLHFQYYFLNFQINIFVQNKNDIPSTKLINFILSFFNKWTNSSNTDSKILYFILSKQQKLKPNEKGKILTPININSGFTYGNQLVVFRKEEFFKVLIHELIHLYKLDRHISPNGELKKSIIKKINFEGFDHCIEGYTESLALIIHTALLSFLKNKSFNELLNQEYKFSLMQCLKINNHFGYDKIFQSTSVVSYFFVKTTFIKNFNHFYKSFIKYGYVNEKTLQKYFLRDINNLSCPKIFNFFNSLSNDNDLKNNLKLVFNDIE